MLDSGEGAERKADIMMPGLVFAVASRGRLDQGIRAKPRDHVAKRKEAPAGASAGGR